MNRLGQENSPYLLQHKDNPIHWYAWGPDAFAAAKKENKPIFLSIGYSTCHWCHVMAHESFEDQEVAAALNKSFISIKLDREERPDIDDIYMTAVQTLTGGGGWPMSVWLNSDGKPFFAGTYFPKFRFLQLLRRIEQIWAAEGDKLEEDSRRLFSAIERVTKIEPTDAVEADFEEFLSSYIGHFQHHFDDVNGGFGGAPKFPQTMNLMAMMRQDRRSGLHQAEALVTKTLLGMVRGGIFDQLRGGFHRYSVDEQWLVPHFEKMLYDQALLAITLLEAYQLYGDLELARGARETLDYVLREMTSMEGGFYCAQDADSMSSDNHMEEGYFATFTFQELNQLLNEEELQIVQQAYGVSRNGNFEGRNILHLQENYDGSVKENQHLQTAFGKMDQLRAGRAQPHLDDKIITSWNGWMIWAFCKGAQVLGEPKYLKAAQNSGRFLQRELWHKNQLLRRWRAGEAAIPALAEDYTSLINACISLYETDFDVQWVEWAMALQENLDQKFWDETEGGYFTEDGHDTFVILRAKEDNDGVRPSSNSMAALNLLRLYHWTGEVRFKQKAEAIFQLMFERMRSFPSTLPFMAVALDFYVADVKEVVLAGQAEWLEKFRFENQKSFQPHLVWAKANGKIPVANKPNDQAAVFVCEEGKCLKPALDLTSAKAALSK